MANFLTDTLISISRDNSSLPLVGFDSKYSNVPNPGTGKSIIGWEWDKRLWPSKLEEQSEYTVPSIWDPDNSSVLSTQTQSGIGDNQDLFVPRLVKTIRNGVTTWVPSLQHGYYYDHTNEGYLFSDGCEAETFQDGILINGFNYLDLTYIPKPGIPITATKFKWNSTKGSYSKYLSFKKKYNFTGSKNLDGTRKSTRDISGNIIYANVDTGITEFVVEKSTPRRAILSGSFVQTHGVTPPTLASMESLGLAQGINGEEFHTQYSPVLSGSIQVVSFFSTSGSYTTWTVVPQITANFQCTVDLDLGIVKFGDGTNRHPNPSETVAVFYKSSVVLEYEPSHTIDTVEGYEVNIDPLGENSSTGFIFLSNQSIDPTSIQLTSDASLIATNSYGPLDLGLSSKLTALVLSSNNQPVQGQDVTFTITNNIPGFSGGTTSIDSASDFNGNAHTTFLSQKNVKNLGATSVAPGDVVWNGGNTQITLNTTNLTGDPATWYIYQVYSDDPSLGITNIAQYYTTFFSQEGITGPTTNMDVSGSGWESNHRILANLLTPSVYNAAFRNGRKVLVSTWSASAVNPHHLDTTDSLNLGAFIPLRPSAANLITVSGTLKTQVIVPGNLPIPGSAGFENLQGYFISGPGLAVIRASLFNPRTNETIYSNTISIQLSIPISMDGTVLIQNLNAAQYGNVFQGITNKPTSGILPLGFRLRSGGISLASALGGLTYFDINRDTGVLGHAFTVKDPGV